MFNLFQKKSRIISVKDVDLLTPEMIKAIDVCVSNLSGSYAETALQQLNMKLREGIKDGLGFRDMAKLISTIHEFSNHSYIEIFTQTLVSQINIKSQIGEWKNTGIVRSKMWITADDDRVCPFCDALNKKKIGLNKNFFNQGDVVRGSDGSVMTIENGDIVGPPLHDSCRCSLTPEDMAT